MGSLLDMPWHNRQKIVKVMLTATQLICFRMLEKSTMLSRDYIYYTFHLLKICVDLSAFYFCSINTARHFGVYVCWYVLAGVIVNEHSLTCIFFVLFSVVCINLLPEISWAIFHIFRQDNKDIRRMKQGNAFNLYFILFFMLTLGYNYYNTNISGTVIECTESILLSTLGICCASMIPTHALCCLIRSISTLLFKCCYFAITGLSDIEPEQYLSLPFVVSPYVFMIDVIISDMEPYERGKFVIVRLSLISAMFVENCLSIIEITTSRKEIIKGNMFTCLRVVCINLIFILGPLILIYYLFVQYEWDNLGIILTMSNVIGILIYATYLLCFYILLKYFAVLQNVWNGLNIILFDIKIYVCVSSIFIQICTVALSVWTFLFYFYNWLDLLRFIFIVYDIFSWRALLQSLFSNRNEIMQFNRSLVDA